jgi:pimeloyl-ACP methyl ester carboxylesterase
MTTKTLDVPGAVLTYDIRPNEASTEPILLLFGCPMGASGFPTLASHFSDRTVVTYDPRGVERSKRTDAAVESNPHEHAEDLHRLITALGAGAVDLFATSGGAVNALALVAAHPSDVWTVVAHEPPLAEVLPDRDAVLASIRDIHDTYLRVGLGPAMAKFIAISSRTGPLPPDYAEQPGPDPAMFGLPTEDDGDRDNPLVGQNIIGTVAYRPDFDALRAARTHIVLAAGTTSEGQLANRAAHAVAERLGTTAIRFPSDHGGFLGGEYGQTGEPEAFAATLRDVLAAQPASTARVD